MAHFEKVRTEHERWTVQRPCAHACTSQSHAGLGAWPIAFNADRLKRYRGAKDRDTFERCGRP